MAPSSLLLAKHRASCRHLAVGFLHLAAAGLASEQFLLERQREDYAFRLAELAGSKSHSFISTREREKLAEFVYNLKSLIEL